MRVAAIQGAPVYLDTDATINKVLHYIATAAANGAELIAFPEAFVPGYPLWLRQPSVFRDDALLQLGHAASISSAIRVDGPELAAVTAEAASRGVFVYLGFVERNESGGSVYASLGAIHPDRGLIGVHRKLKPTFHERLIWSDGDACGLHVHDWQGFPVGALNCYENWQPLARQALYEQGEALHVAAWPGDLDVTDPVSRFIAMEGRMYVISASGVLRAGDIPLSFALREQVVAGRDIINDGGSMLVAPDGTLLAGPVTDCETILYADVDMDTVRAARLKLDPAGHYGRNELLHLTVNRHRPGPPGVQPPGRGEPPDEGETTA